LGAPAEFYKILILLAILARFCVISRISPFLVITPWARRRKKVSTCRIQSPAEVHDFDSSERFRGDSLRSVSGDNIPQRQSRYRPQVSARFTTSGLRRQTRGPEDCRSSE